MNARKVSYTIAMLSLMIAAAALAGCANMNGEEMEGVELAPPPRYLTLFIKNLSSWGVNLTVEATFPGQPSAITETRSYYIEASVYLNKTIPNANSGSGGTYDITASAQGNRSASGTFQWFDQSHYPGEDIQNKVTIFIYDEKIHMLPKEID